MKQLVRSSAVAAMLLFSSDGFAQQLDWNITGAGARAEGFGGAFIGVADDATAVVWNPAGLSQLERPEASVVTKFISESLDYTDNTDPSQNSSESQSHFALNFGSFALPLKAGGNNIVVAVAYQRQLDMYGRSKTVTSSYTEDYESSGGANTITPGVGVSLSPVISVGASANIWLSSYDITDKLAILGTDYTQTVNGTFSGFNFVLGGLFDFSGLKSPVPLKLGVSLKTPFNLKIDQAFKTSPAIPSYEFNDVNATLTAQMPLMLGFGGSYRIGENLTLAADYEMRGYGSKQFTQDVNGMQSTGQMSDSKKNLNQFRVGAEYLVVTDAGVFPIRAGFQTLPTVLADYDANGNPIDQVVGNGFAVGTGFISGTFALDLTYSRNSYDQGDTYTTTSISKSMITGSVIVYF